MGVPFPTGMLRLADTREEAIPWAWAINGFASVVGAVLATLLAIHMGFAAVILLAVLIYARGLRRLEEVRMMSSGERWVTDTTLRLKLVAGCA